MAFRHLRAELLRLDCQGNLRPRLVQSWTSEAPGILTLTLKTLADAGPGSPPPAAAVAARLASTGSPVSGIDSAVTLNMRQVRLFITAAPDSVLRGLADPAIALPGGIPIQGPQPATVLDLPANPGRPALQLRLAPLGDPRDALDRGSDLIVTRDPALLEYAAHRPEVAVYPLPWSRTYVLVQPEPAPSLAPLTTDPERQSLARDAVHADARGAEPPFWWAEGACPVRGTPAAAPTSERVVYPQEDEVARALAERLVALAAPGNGLRAAGLEHSQLAAALRQGSERAYVLSFPKQPLHPCQELTDLPATGRVQPLIETRAYAIVRHGAPPLGVDWDGTVQVVGP